MQMKMKMKMVVDRGGTGVNASASGIANIARCVRYVRSVSCIINQGNSSIG